MDKSCSNCIYGPDKSVATCQFCQDNSGWQPNLTILGAEIARLRLSIELLNHMLVIAHSELCESCTERAGCDHKRKESCLNQTMHDWNEQAREGLNAK